MDIASPSPHTSILWNIQNKCIVIWMLVCVLVPMAMVAMEFCSCLCFHFVIGLFPNCVHLFLVSSYWACLFISPKSLIVQLYHEARDLVFLVRFSIVFFVCFFPSLLLLIIITDYHTLTLSVYIFTPAMDFHYDFCIPGLSLHHSSCDRRLCLSVYKVWDAMLKKIGLFFCSFVTPINYRLLSHILSLSPCLTGLSVIMSSG